MVFWCRWSLQSSTNPFSGAMPYLPWLIIAKTFSISGKLSSSRKTLKNLLLNLKNEIWIGTDTQMWSWSQKSHVFPGNWGVMIIFKLHYSVMHDFFSGLFRLCTLAQIISSTETWLGKRGEIPSIWDPSIHPWSLWSVAPAIWEQRWEFEKNGKNLAIFCKPTTRTRTKLWSWRLSPGCSGSFKNVSKFRSFWRPTMTFASTFSRWSDIFDFQSERPTQIGTTVSYGPGWESFGTPTANGKKSNNILSTIDLTTSS